MTDTNFNRQRLLRRLQRTTKQVVDDPNIKIKTARTTKEGTPTPKPRQDQATEPAKRYTIIRDA